MRALRRVGGRRRWLAGIRAEQRGVEENIHTDVELTIE